MSENRKPFETFAHYKIGKGFATLAVSVDEGFVNVGISYCHPRDYINKSYGRDVARARRDSDSTFSFSFNRTSGVKLGDQLRTEFERFVEQSGTQLTKIRQLVANGILTEEDSIRSGAPPWAIHSLEREVRKRNRINANNEDMVDCDMLDLSRKYNCCV
jgi:hypothetical protein